MAVFADALIRLLERGRLQALCLPRDTSSDQGQITRVVETINTAPAARSLTAVHATVRRMDAARNLFGLAASTASHALERILFDSYLPGADEPGADASPYHLLAIPTLRVLGIDDYSWHVTKPAHLRVLRDGVRARAKSGAAPLHTLAFAGTGEFHEDEERVAENVAPVMQAESPSTSVRVMYPPHCGL